MINPKNLDIKKELGRGAFGVVNMARYRGAKVAVKQLLTDTLKQGAENQMEEFIREAKLLTSIQSHPNLVQVIGYCMDPPMIVMEYLDGGSLLHALGKGVIRDEEKIQICHGIALGMVHLHEDGIIHRDLAARNILLTKSMQPKVTDFGLSRAVGETEYCNTNSDIGPVRWMAPEALKKQVFSKKSDVWSFGVLVWEVVSNGELPYHKYTSLAAVFAALMKKKAVLEIPETAPQVLAELIGLCMQRNPEQRPDFEQLSKMLANNDESASEESGLPSNLNSNHNQDSSVFIGSNYLV